MVSEGAAASRATADCHNRPRTPHLHTATWHAPYSVVDSKHAAPNLPLYLLCCPPFAPLPLPPRPPLQILICQNLRNNLQHPNEYIRGVTLRFLCRIHEEELLEPLVPSGAARARPGASCVGGVGGQAGLAVLAGWLAASWERAGLW